MPVVYVHSCKNKFYYSNTHAFDDVNYKLYVYFIVFKVLTRLPKSLK